MKQLNLKTIVELSNDEQQHVVAGTSDDDCTCVCDCSCKCFVEEGNKNANTQAQSDYVGESVMLNKQWA